MPKGEPAMITSSILLIPDPEKRSIYNTSRLGSFLFSPARILA
jgi:hypothetical protein